MNVSREYYHPDNHPATRRQEQLLERLRNLVYEPSVHDRILVLAECSVIVTELINLYGHNPLIATDRLRKHPDLIPDPEEDQIEPTQPYES